jgi:TP901 family phage tail tape measure protein
MASSRIKGITVEIGGDTTGLQSALKEVNSSIKTTQSSLKDVNKLLKLDPTNTELLSQKQKLLKEAIGETTTKLESLKVAQEQAIDSNEALCKIEAAGEALESVGNTISGVGQKMLTVTAGVTALGTAAVSTTATFDSSLSQVQATLGITSDAMSDLNGESVNTMDALRSLAKEMGSSTAFSASECADAMNYLALAGYDTQLIYDTLPTVLNLAAAGSIDLATASDMVTDAMSALGMETSEADTMVDQMAKTSSKTNTSVAQLGEAILSIGATAKSIKGGTAELNTALGILANNGIKGAEGGTHLRNVILALQSPTNTAAACIEQLGLEVYDSEGNMRSLNDILSDLNSSMDSMTSAEKNDIISTIFNKTDIASVNALLANTGETWDSLQESITESGGAAQQMADTQLDNLSGQITILKSALEGLAISFGEVLMPAVRSAVEKVQAFVDKLNSMSDAQRETIIKIAAFVAALGPLLIILGKTISTVGSAMKGFSTMTKSVVKLGVKIAGSSGSITGLGSALSAVAVPVLAVVAVIAVLVAAFKHLWDTNEEFRDTVTAIWDGIKSKFEAFASGITERLNALGFDFESIVEVLKAVWDGFCNLLVPVFEAAFSVIS